MIFLRIGTCISCPAGWIFNSTTGICMDPCISSTYNVTWQGSNCICESWDGSHEGDYDMTTGTCSCSQSNKYYCQCDTSSGLKSSLWGCIGECTSSCSPAPSKTCGSGGGC